MRLFKSAILASAALFVGCVPSGTCDQACADTANYAMRTIIEREQIQLHPFLVCVRRHESDRGPYPHVNGYGAQNPISTASGAYQFLDSTWRNASAAAGFTEWSRAKWAPWWVQDAVAYDLGVKQGARSHWAGSGC